MTSPASKSPFPYLGTVAIEGTRLDVEPGMPEGGLITLPLECILRVRRVIETYVGRYTPGRANVGSALLLRGPHGAGKTHSLRFALQQILLLSRSRQDAPESARRPIEVYVKLEGSDFLAVYRRAMNQVPLDTLRELVVASFAVLTGEQVGIDSDDVKLGQQAIENLRQQPEIAGRLFGDADVDRTVVSERWQREIDTITSGRPELQYALSALLDPELGATAYAWLCAQDGLNEDQAAKIGLRGRLSSGEDARTGLALLAALCGRAGRPFALFLDQYEKLIFNQDGSVNKTNVGLLHSVVETVPREGGLIALAGNLVAFDALPPDLVQRFGSVNIIDFPTLTPTQARALLALYLHSDADRSFDSFDSRPEDLEPFEPEAVDELHFFSDGNPRRLLQMAADVFSSVDVPRITSEVVRATLKQYSHVYFDRASVLREIDQLAAGRGLRFERDFKLGEVKVGGAVLAPDGSALVLVEVRESRFYNDEARNALTALLQVIRLRASEQSLPFVFVSLGYTSSEVAEYIGRFAQLVVYSPDTFKSRFEALLVALPVQSSSTHLEREFAALREQLTSVVASRDTEAKTLETRITDFVLRQSETRREERLEAARPAWLSERRTIEEQIRAARADRRARELLELERLRARAQAEWRNRTRWRLGATLVLAAIAVAALVLAYNATSVSEEQRWTTVAFAAVLGLFGVLYYLIYIFRTTAWNPALGFDEFFGFRSRASRELADEVGSVEDLDRLAHLAFRQMNSAKTQYLLDHANPHFRYAAALHATEFLTSAQLEAVFSGERSAIVRRLLAQRIGRVRDTNLLASVLANPAAEVAYALEVLALSHGDLYDVVYRVKLTRRFVTLAALLGVGTPSEFGRANLLVRLLSEQQKPDGGPLAQAFSAGLERAGSGLLASISPEEVRQTIADLSPLEPGGLGTLDSLRGISDIDRYYLFFRQLEFFLERDLLPSAS